MNSIFRNQKENRLKAGWRILLFILIVWSISALSLAIKPLFGDLTRKAFLSNYSLLVVAILTIATIAGVFVARKYFDKKSVASLGLQRSKRSFKDILFGFFLSGLMAGLFLLTAYLMGAVEIDGITFSEVSNAYLEIIQTFSWLSMLLFLLEYVLVGYWEELFFRGYLFQNMREGMGTTWSIMISCVIYGLIHAPNPNATLLSSSIIIAFGFLRIYGYLTTNMLWLSIGMHIGWNFFQGPIFGFATSGHQKPTLIELTIKGPDWLSGGSFGPEGSILIIPILLVALFVMKIWGEKSRKVYQREVKSE